MRSVATALKWPLSVAATLLLASRVLAALDGDPGMHDPSTIVVHDGKFYVYATGGGLPIAISDDGWTWRRAGTLMQALPGGRPGPDVIARGGNNAARHRRPLPVTSFIRSSTASVKPVALAYGTGSMLLDYRFFYPSCEWTPKLCAVQ